MVKYNLTKSQIAHIRLLKSGINNEFNSVEECINKLIGIQSQYQQYSLISIHNRVKNCNMNDIEKLGKLRKIIKIWGQRLTLHIYTIDDWELISSIFSLRNNWVKNYCEKLNIDIEETLDNIYLIAKDKELLSKKDIENGIENKNRKEIMQWGGILIQATLNNEIFGIVSLDNKKIYSHKKWLKNYNKKLNCDYLKQLIERYFSNYGPATINDFKHWSGLNQYEFIDAFNEIDDRFLELTYNSETYYLLILDKPILEQKIKNANLKMIGKFDPLLVSYRDKEWITDKKYLKEIWKSAGQIEAVLILDNNIIGTWRYASKKNKINFKINLFENITEETKHKIMIEVKKISIFLNKECENIYYKSLR